MRSTVSAVLLVALVALLVGACGGDDSTADEPPPPPADELTLDDATAEQPLDPLEPELPPGPPEAETGSQSAAALRIDPDGESLKIGSRGDRVERLQRSLRALGYEAGPPDGAYGAQTEEAVKSFQSQNGLQNDGVAGMQTIRAINSAVAAGVG